MADTVLVGGTPQSRRGPPWHHVGSRCLRMICTGIGALSHDTPGGLNVLRTRRNLDGATVARHLVPISVPAAPFAG